MAAPLLWEGIDDAITSSHIEYGTLKTAITREILKFLIYFLLPSIIIPDGLSVSKVYPKINFDLIWPSCVLPFLHCHVLNGQQICMGVVT